MTIDIMMPLWGRTDHFQVAVESVLAQIDDDWRLVVIDDRNPDPTAAAWLRRIDDPRVEYLLNEENLGPGANFQRAAELARADRVVIMGCDDVMHPEFVARIAELENAYPNAAIIEVGVDVIDANGRATLPLADRVKRFYTPRSSSTLELSGEDLAVSLLRGNWLYFPSLAWRRSELQRFGFRSDRDVVQDLTLIMEIVFDGGSLVYDRRVAFDYRRHASSVSWRAGPDGSRFAEERRLFADVAGWAEERGWRRAARQARWHGSSRLNGATQLLAAARAGDARGILGLIRHVVGGSGDPVDDDPRR